MKGKKEKKKKAAKEKKKKKLEVFREEQRAQIGCVRAGKTTESTEKSQAAAFKANVNLRESLGSLDAEGALLTLG